MYLLLSLFTQVLSKLQPGSLELLAKTWAIIFFDILRLRRRLTLSNLQRAFGKSLSHSERVRIGRASYKNFLLTLLETFSSQRYPLAAQTDIVGKEHLETALAQQQGVYALCFHMGNWEAMAAKITQDFAPVFAVMKPIGSPGMTSFIEELRHKNGLHWIKRNQKGDGYRGIQEVLARGEIVGFIIDQARPGEPKLSFFGHPAKTNTSFAAIWRKSLAPIVPVFIKRHQFGQHTVVCLPALELALTSDKAADILAHSQLFNDLVEAVVRQYPEQYFWMHNRWK